jgi:hypothetical protein
MELIEAEPAGSRNFWDTKEPPTFRAGQSSPNFQVYARAFPH